MRIRIMATRAARVLRRQDEKARKRRTAHKSGTEIEALWIQTDVAA